MRLLLLFFFLSTNALASDFSFDLKKQTPEQIAKKYGSKIIEVYDPFLKKKVKYKAISFRKILNLESPNWTQWKAVDLLCSDGFKPKIETAKIKKYDSYIAYAYADNSPFRLKKFEGKKDIDLGPYLLVWDTIKHPELKAKGSHGWAWAVVAINQPEKTSPFTKIAPPKNSSEMVNRGFKAYTKYCYQCHAINGHGGEVGPELNYPVSVTKYFKKEYLLEWIIDPSQIRAKSKMIAPFPAEVKNKKQMAKQIYAYLKAMENTKK